MAVEFALVLPLLGMLLFGIVSFGLAFSDRIALVNAVREGARFGASANNDALWADAVEDRTAQLYANVDSPLTSSQVCAILWLQPASGAATIQQKSSDACAAGTAPAGAVPHPLTDAPADSCYLMVWAAKPADVNWLVHTTTITLTAESVAFYSRDTAPCTYEP